MKDIVNLWSTFVRISIRYSTFNDNSALKDIEHVESIKLFGFEYLFLS